MSAQTGTSVVASERLRLSRAPAAEIAAAALQAQRDAGLERADFVVLAVEPGKLDAAKAAVDGAASSIE